MSNNYAVLDSDGIVVNIIVWDGEEELITPERWKLVEIVGDDYIEIGEPLE